MTDLYDNQLQKYLTQPGSFSGSPGYQFAYDQGLQATDRANSRRRNSGNALTALMRFGTGLASQDYGNTIDRLTRLSGQEQQYKLGLGGLSNNAVRNANDFTLGMGQNALTGQRDFWNYDLGRERNSIESANNQNNFNLANPRPSRGSSAGGTQMGGGTWGGYSYW